MQIGLYTVVFRVQQCQSFQCRKSHLEAGTNRTLRFAPPQLLYNSDKKPLFRMGPPNQRQNNEPLRPGSCATSLGKRKFSTKPETEQRTFEIWKLCYQFGKEEVFFPINNPSRFSRLRKQKVSVSC